MYLRIQQKGQSMIDHLLDHNRSKEDHLQMQMRSTLLVYLKIIKII